MNKLFKILAGILLIFASTVLLGLGIYLLLGLSVFGANPGRTEAIVFILLGLLGLGTIWFGYLRVRVGTEGVEMEIKGQKMPDDLPGYENVDEIER